MRKYIVNFIFLIIFFTGPNFVFSKCYDTEIQEIEDEIKQLENIRLGLEGKAIKYENQAQRLQFKKESLLEARRYWKMAAQNRKMIKEIDAYIEVKKDQKLQFLQKSTCH